jgi:ABC-type uncharacterized transport system auxiliary subunit
MPVKTLAITTACTLTLLISGCSGTVRYPSYHTLSIAPALKTDASVAPQPVSVAVRRFETPAYLRQGRIVYSEAPGEIGFYEYHRWAADPGATVTTAVVDSLRSSHMFSFVAPYDGPDRPDYLLTGRLVKLDEIDYGGGVKVEAKLSAELTNLRTGAIVWSGGADESSKVDSRNVDSVVNEMSHALQGSINRLLAGMEHQVSAADVSAR